MIEIDTIEWFGRWGHSCFLWKICYILSLFLIYTKSLLMHRGNLNIKCTFERCFEIMVLFVLRKLILQTRIHSRPVGLDVWFMVGLFFYTHTLCVRTLKALARLGRCAGSPEPSLVAYVISTISSLYKSSVWFFSVHCVIKLVVLLKFLKEFSEGLHGI